MVLGCLAVFTAVGFDSSGRTDDFAEDTARGDDLSMQHVVGCKACQQDFTVFGAVAVIGDVDIAVGRLEPVGIRDALTFVELQSALPGKTVIFGDKSP